VKQGLPETARAVTGGFWFDSQNGFVYSKDHERAAMDLASLPKDQLMINALKRWLKPTRSRLSRRIVFYVFVSVVVIETIILIPSTMKREKELLQQMRSVAWARSKCS
jgi:hypothetical protein